MKRLCLAAMILLSCRPAQAADAPSVRLDEAQRAFFADFCIECHGRETQEGKLRLDNIAFEIQTVEQADRWQKILNALNSGEMPPDDSAQPDRTRKTELLDTLSQTLARARKVIGDQGGLITLRRLNQREYKNTIRALLGVEIDVRDLPADGGIGTFDTVGASLFMSSDQIEQYLAIARRALDEHFHRTRAREPRSLSAREEAEVIGNKRMNSLYERTKQMHDNYVRWTTAVDEAAQRPENVAKIDQLKLDAQKLSGASASPRAAPLLYYHLWHQIAGAPSPEEFGFHDSQAALFEELQYRLHYTYYADYQQLPGRDRGAWLLFYQAYRETYVSAGESWPAGRYKLRLRVAANDAAPPFRRFIEVGQRGDDPSDFTVFSAHQVTGTLEQPQMIELSVDVGTRGKREFAVREKRPNSRKAEINIFADEVDRTGHGPVPAVWIDWFEIEGPQPEPYAASVSLIASTHDRRGAREVIERFARRAFRGATPSAEYLDRLVGLFETRRALGESFEDALKEPLSVVLASPSFLYLAEPSTAAGQRRLSSFELASRLSYLLWSGPPDNELLALAASDALHSPGVLAAQVDRMIADDRSREFASGFMHQWLGMDRLEFFQFDYRMHRQFDDSTKAAAREEVYRTVSYLLRENQSLTRLLKSDFVVVNAVLADYYGLDGVRGDEFRKVALPPGSPRGGLLGMAAILAMGSNGQYTSPVERGEWVLRKLLNDPPPPAPPNVPQLSRLDGKMLSVRERLKAHQEEPQCASCHRKIDPIGFGLENFDASGKWRTEDIYQLNPKTSKTWPVDAAASFYHGPSFANYFEFRDIIESNADAFAHCFTEALIEYALGRPYGFLDDELAANIIHRARANGFAMREFIHALVSSEAFCSK
ncbi:MAG TPA: DUF1592 domain-containing protein [Pirellulales bacterium]|nr:DUF1592 domain-containing protein [Pirellulales bacterium]